MGFLNSYKMRVRRKRLHLRAYRGQRHLTCLADRTSQISTDDILLFSTLRNEHVRLPFFLKYYRNLGVDHFFFVDNGSDDASAAYLADQPDVTLYSAPGSYKAARFGMDWITALQRRHAHGHWSLVVDVDEFFVYPFCDVRPLRALTDWLQESSIRAFGAMLVDMYPKGPVEATHYVADQDPLEISPWFDSGNYTIERNAEYWNLWIQGGPRARMFFREEPWRAPALNKIPLVKWHRSYAYVSSTHMLLPRGLNLVYDTEGGEKASGCLLHTKFIGTFSERAQAEVIRNEHFANSAEYKAYQENFDGDTEIWRHWSERYLNWRQLEILGLMSKGNWA